MDRHESVNLPVEITLWPQGQMPLAEEVDGNFPRMHYYLPSPEYRTGQSVLILPGGGYGLVSSAKEGHRPAQLLAAQGIAAGVLEYRHAPRRYPLPVVDAQRGMRQLRALARHHALREDAVGVMGFSAGGHLAGTVATHPDMPEGHAGDELDAVSPAADFQILIYPVVSLAAEFAHTGSADNLLGPEADAALARRLSVENAVNAQTPPALIIHGQADRVVAPAHALRLFEALTGHGVPATLHCYAHMEHGVGLAANHAWGRALLEWLASLP